MTGLHSVSMSSHPQVQPPMVPRVWLPQGLQQVLGSRSPLSLFPAAEKVSSLGKDWHKFCLKCERCNKTLTPGGHAEVRAAGADGVGELCCHAGVAWWSIWHAMDGQSQKLGWGGYLVLC